MLPVSDTGVPVASHPAFFHAPEETLRLLSVANETAMQARLKLVSILAKHGVMNYSAPDFSTKEEAERVLNTIKTSGRYFQTAVVVRYENGVRIDPWAK